MIVVDANIIAYWAIDGEYTEPARRLREMEPDWIVPALCRHELANVLTIYVKHGAMEVADAQVVWQGIESIIFEREYDIELSRAIAVAVETGTSAYDAQYLMLARIKAIPFVTQDRQLVSRSEQAFTLQDYLEA